MRRELAAVAALVVPVLAAVVLVGITELLTVRARRRNERRMARLVVTRPGVGEVRILPRGIGDDARGDA